MINKKFLIIIIVFLQINNFSASEFLKENKLGVFCASAGILGYSSSGSNELKIMAEEKKDTFEERLNRIENLGLFKKDKNKENQLIKDVREGCKEHKRLLEQKKTYLKNDNEKAQSVFTERVIKKLEEDLLYLNNQLAAEQKKQVFLNKTKLAGNLLIILLSILSRIRFKTEFNYFIGSDFHFLLISISYVFGFFIRSVNCGFIDLSSEKKINKNIYIKLDEDELKKINQPKEEDK